VERKHLGRLLPLLGPLATPGSTACSEGSSLRMLWIRYRPRTNAMLARSTKPVAFEKEHL
jgi:hypothetical protein